MRRTWTLTVFLLKDFSRSLAVVVPPGLLLALDRVLFQYGGDVPYFAAMGGAMLGLICVATALLLNHASNRASTYPLLARTHRRAELVTAIGLATALIMLLVALAFVAIVVLGRQVPLRASDLPGIAVRWLAVLFFLIALTFHLGRLVARWGSNLIAYLLLILTLISFQRLDYLSIPVLDVIENVMTAALRPVTATIAGGADLATTPLFASAVLVTLLYGLVLYLLAIWLFRRKDLTWAE